VPSYYLLPDVPCYLVDLNRPFLHSQATSGDLRRHTLSDISRHRLCMPSHQTGHHPRPPPGPPLKILRGKGCSTVLVLPPMPLSTTRPVFPVSLLADAPSSPESSTVLGWLPAETPGDDCNAGLNDFVENRICQVHGTVIEVWKYIPQERIGQTTDTYEDRPP